MFFNIGNAAMLGWVDRFDTKYWLSGLAKGGFIFEITTVCWFTIIATLGSNLDLSLCSLTEKEPGLAIQILHILHVNILKCLKSKKFV